MLECPQNGCICKDACNIIGCIYKHPLVNEDNISKFKNEGVPISIKECLSVFQSIDPPKVSGEQINKYYLKKKYERLHPSLLITKKYHQTKGYPYLKFKGRRYNYAGVLPSKGEAVYYCKKEKNYLLESGLLLDKQNIDPLLKVNLVWA